VVVLATTEFYVAGGVLAGWAVVLTALGMLNPKFPGNLGGQRVVIAISAVLVVLAIGAAVTTSKTEDTHQPGITKPAKHG
jgi:membrane protein implicated in regulation of membrane protease activity